MPYKDKEAKRKHDRDDKRERRGTTLPRDDMVGTTTKAEGSQIPKELMPVIRAMSDIEKRAKLRLICQSLSDHKMLKNVRYGYYGPDMAVVGELLSAF